MCKSNIEIIDELGVFLKKANENKADYCETKGAFTKTKRLTFLCVILFIINMPRKTLSIELEEFYEEIKQPEKEVSKSAFLNLGRS